jgi:hypothetical protein
MSMRGLKAAALAALAGSSFWTGPALAAAYTFVVPVRIENMANVTQASVSCDVYQGDGVSRRQIGFGQTEIAVSGGAYAQTVTVPVNMVSGFLPSDATSWHCGLTYLWQMPDHTTFYRSVLPNESREDLYTRYTGQVVTSAHTSESGTIAR